ncbi:putative tubulin--tyrosine ligase pby1 [Savitreella phatthalungensis]
MVRTFLRPPAFLAETINVRLARKFPSLELVDDPTQAQLQWADYEELDFETPLKDPSHWVCAYCIRKALIRKHHLAACVREYVAKRPDSVLRQSVPPSHNLELDYAEFLDDSLDEAFELKGELSENEALPIENRRWYILKGGMAERGAGLRLFSTQDELQAIFDAREAERGDEEDDEDEMADPLSDMRFYVVQEYMSNPLLLPQLQHRKFHLRVYVLAVGALTVYVHRNILVLASGTPYEKPSFDEADLGRHLTNTCYQTNLPTDRQLVYDFWQIDLAHDDIFSSAKAVTAELFKAASGQRIHFQPLPNAFEVFGLDYLVDASSSVHLLEVNAYPDFAQTGDGLKGLVDGVANDMVDVVVDAIEGRKGQNSVGGFERCLSLELM